MALEQGMYMVWVTRLEQDLITFCLVPIGLRLMCSTHVISPDIIRLGVTSKAYRLTCYRQGLLILWNS